MTTAHELDERYGRRRRRRLPWIIGGAFALAVVVAFSWMTVASSLDSVDADDLGFDVIDEHSVNLRFQVTATAGTDIVCIVEAQDEEFGVVGWKVVRIPASDSHAQALSVSIPTVATATTGLVNTCWVA